MDYRVTKTVIFLFILFCMSCNVPYASFKAIDKEIFVRGQNAEAIVTNTPCNEVSTDYLILKYGGIKSVMRLFVDLCDTSYSVIAFGYFKKVGEPKFEFTIRTWG